MLLTDFIRHELGLTGTHVGCDMASVAPAHRDRRCPGTRLLTLAVQVDGGGFDCRGAGAGAGRFRRCRRRFAGITPCSAASALPAFWCRSTLPAQPLHPSEAELRNFLSGHLCRCTGYTPIIAERSMRQGH